MKQLKYAKTIYETINNENNKRNKEIMIKPKKMKSSRKSSDIQPYINTESEPEKTKDYIVEKLDLSYNATEAIFQVNGLGIGLGGDNKYLCWCQISLYIKNRFFHYNQANDDMLLYQDVVYIRDVFNALLNDEITEVYSFSFAEPDLTFNLYPKEDLDLRKDIGFFTKGPHIQDIHAQLVINLSDYKYGINGQTYTFPMNRDEIKLMKKYLDRAITLLDKQWEESR